ncbi:MAG: hypothetical protein JST87_05305 [Bacteroidetes bacterium]|nr:hypothetical protein [Bacteroidota bacterium]
MNESSKLIKEKNLRHNLGVLEKVILENESRLSNEELTLPEILELHIDQTEKVQAAIWVTNVLNQHFPPQQRIQTPPAGLIKSIN